MCDFSQLEKMRGRMCSLALVCPLTRLYIRQITHSLSLAEGLLQPEVALTPDLMDELQVWGTDPLFLDSSRSFAKVGEIDLDFHPRITTNAGVIEYHSGKFVPFSQPNKHSIFPTHPIKILNYSKIYYTGILARKTLVEKSFYPKEF